MDKCPVCGRAHMIIDPEAPGATAQVLGNFPPQVDMGSLLAGFLSFDIRLGWHLQALPPRDPVWLWIVSIYTASSSRSAPSVTTSAHCGPWVDRTSRL